MIYIITGPTGVGKTAYQAFLARDLLKRGERVFSNIKLYPEKMKLADVLPKNFEGDISVAEDRNNPQCRILYWQHRADWQYFSEGTVFCQEGLGYFNARDWAALPQALQMKLVQNRKDKIDIYVDVQHWMFVDIQIRRLAERVIFMKRFLGSRRFKKSIIPRVTRLYDFDIPTLEQCQNFAIDPTRFEIMTSKEKEKYAPIAKDWFWIKQKRMDYYNSVEQVAPPRPDPLVHIERKCLEPDCNKIHIRHV